MKRFGYLYEKVYDIENVKLAIQHASKGKKKRRYVRKVLCNVDYHAERIANSLKDGTYKLSPNRCKTIKDGASQKERDITIPAFYPDQIIQWALVQVLTPIFMRGMYEHNCGSIPHRGGIAAKRYVDDMVLLDNDKAKLHRARLELSNYLQREGYGLTLKENWQLWQVDTRPIDFVGYKLYSSRTLLRRANFNRIKRLIERIKVKGLSIKRARRYMSYYGWCKNSNFKGYYLLRVKPVISTSNICRYISVRG